MANGFAGGDQHYICTTQYGTTDKLAARQQMHERCSTAPTRWFEWMVDEIPWAAGPVVEVGCGPGNLWEEGRPSVRGPVLLTDLSAGMVATATARATAAGYVVEGWIAAAEKLPVADAAATHVISNHMLYHVPHPPDAVAELARVVADDGLVSVATNGEHHMKELKQIESAVFGTSVAQHTVTAFGLTSGRAMLDTAFADVELRRFPDSLRVTRP